MHSDWVNDIVLTNHNQTGTYHSLYHAYVGRLSHSTQRDLVVTASSDGTVKAWNPHANSEPSIVGQHADYVRCLTYWYVDAS